MLNQFRGTKLLIVLIILATGLYLMGKKKEEKDLEDLYGLIT